jgi:hypothetical protein
MPRQCGDEMTSVTTHACAMGFDEQAKRLLLQRSTGDWREVWRVFGQEARRDRIHERNDRMQKHPCGPKRPCGPKHP